MCKAGTCAKFSNDPSLCGGKATDGCSGGQSCVSGGGPTTCTSYYTHYQDKGSACSSTAVTKDNTSVTHTCKKEFYCDEKTGTCLDKLANGSACEVKGKIPCFNICDSKTATCTALPSSAGASCDGGCGGGLACVKGVCGQRLAAGMACDNGNNCVSDHCDKNVCRAVCAIP